MTIPTTNRRLISILAGLLLTVSAQAVVAPGEYYIVNNFWGKLLSSNNDNTPRLMAYNAQNDDAFIFMAEASGTSGYVKLKHKATGLYLTASTSNSWSVLLSSNGSGDPYLWAVDQLFDTYIVNKKNTSARLGSDFYNGGNYYYDATEVPVYYNKGAGALNWYAIIPANGNGFEASRKATQTTVFTNEYGVSEQDDYCVSEPVEVNGIDYHIISTTPFEGTGCVNLNGRTSWLVFENIRPSKVISSYLNNVTIDGQAATNGANCRVEIWMRGAVVIPTPAEAPFVANTDEGTFAVPVGNTANLAENSNKARSFTLKRGYMATVATAANGGDYSRVYVADHADLTVSLPKPLDKRITSVHVRNWHYTSKAGYCSTKSDLLSATVVCGGSWAWNWDAGLTSNADVEYIPIKQHLYWPSDDNFYKEGSTAMMLFNEPEHSEQHTSSKCSCGGTISEWKAYTQTPKFNATGLRIGSPSATDLSWTKSYLKHCDDMKQRCDFSCTHGYWTTEWANNLNTLKGYGRPIWITEWEYGASWTSGSNPSSTDDARAKVFDILEKLEYNDYVERYSYYEFDTGDTGGTNGWMREMFWHNNASEGNAYVGQVYSRVKPHFGYNSKIQPVPNWWEPDAQTPTITTSTALADGQYTLSVANGNGDCTGSFLIQRQADDGTWETIYSVTDRAELELTTLAVTLPAGLVSEDDKIRVVVTTIFKPDTEIMSLEYNIPRQLSKLQNLEFNDGLYTTANITIGDFDGQNEVTGWQPTTSGTYRSAGQQAWGSGLYLGTDAYPYTIPETDSRGKTYGGGLALLAAWDAQLQYTQNVVLPAGTYTITIPVYNAGGTTAIKKNLFGFIADDGTEHLAEPTTFTVGNWTTMSVTLTLTEETYGKLSVGYTHVHSGSTNAPHLYVDYVQISNGSEQWPKLLVGDVNKDGQVTVADVTAIVDIILGKDSTAPYRYNHTAADVNEDNSVTIADVTTLVNILLQSSP